jgi:hypothetical protein
LLRQLRRDRRGAISVVTALTLVMLLGFVGLAIDTGRMLAIRTELQTAVDACALAGALELNGQADATDRALSAATFLAAANRNNFQSATTALTSSQITFSTVPGGPFLTSGGLSGSAARYVRCAADLPGVATYFLSAIGIRTMPTKASAVAGVQPAQAVCSIPMALCKSSNAQAANGNFGYAVGDRAILGGTGNTGFFTWANVSGTISGSGLDPYLQAFVGFGTCGATTANGRCIDIKTGVVSALDDGWNARFGVYKQGGSGLSPTSAIPDLSGYGYRGAGIPAGGAYSDYLSRRVPARDPFQGRISGYSVSTDVNRTYGAPFRRLAVMPVLDCAASTCGSGARPVVGWACVLLLSPKASNENAEAEFVARADDPATPCRASGIAGGAGATGPLVAALVQ